MEPLAIVVYNDMKKQHRNKAIARYFFMYQYSFL